MFHYTQIQSRLCGRANPRGHETGTFGISEVCGILDAKLFWKEHFETQCTRACAHFWMCKKVFGQTWNLRPGIVYWLFSTVFYPRLLYAIVVAEGAKSDDEDVA